MFDSCLIFLFLFFCFSHPIMPNEGFAPIKSTIHIKMLPYSYTNNDVAQLFERFGKIARYSSLIVLYIIIE